MNGQMDRHTLGYSYIYPKICLCVVSIFIFQQICDNEEQKPVFIVNVNNEQDVSKLYIAVQFNSKYMM